MRSSLDTVRFAFPGQENFKHLSFSLSLSKFRQALFSVFNLKICLIFIFGRNFANLFNFNFIIINNQKIQSHDTLLAVLSLFGILEADSAIVRLRLDSEVSGSSGT